MSQSVSLDKLKYVPPFFTFAVSSGVNSPRWHVDWKNYAFSRTNRKKAVQIYAFYYAFSQNGIPKIPTN